ncbi:hotdog fold thioesterase [Taibaiella lutea]|uniref:Hotdog fold thioesterase n=1 Tax=Taibaiella lutea TaxID=2608001 RepID=A0A5M6CHF3_9BACT|nr:hotdog fold thioesterase [Taibaiella lutea]KAA5532579.1 hotdog fold thioesterase [Taibaiella lutea]
MSIWYDKNYTIEALNRLGKDTMAETLGMIFTEIGDDFLKLEMPVDNRSRQPYGLLHGGASAAMAETIGSVASSMCINNEKQICVGIEINCNHLKGVKNGIVTATATPLHLGASSHVWDIKITDENRKLICVSRLTVAILKKREDTKSQIS